LALKGNFGFERRKNKRKYRFAVSQIRNQKRSFIAFLVASLRQLVAACV
jgi:hypothetical protein